MFKTASGVSRNRSPILLHNGCFYADTGIVGADMVSGLDCKLFEELSPEGPENPCKFWLRTDGVRLPWKQEDDEADFADNGDDEIGGEGGGA